MGLFTYDGYRQTERTNTSMKLLRRAMVVWCVYGIIKLGILVNPLLFWVAARVTPYYADNSWSTSLPSVPWDSTAPVQILGIWVIAGIAAGIVFLATVGLHHAAKTIFNEKP